MNLKKRMPEGVYEQIYKWAETENATEAYDKYIQPLIDVYGEHRVHYWCSLFLRELIARREPKNENNKYWLY